MYFEIKQETNGIQKWHRLYIYTNDPKYDKTIDLWEEELVELKRILEDYYVEVIE